MRGVNLLRRVYGLGDFREEVTARKTLDEGT
jgi:hypothetical protein